MPIAARVASTLRLDVRQLARLLVRVDDERLHERRVQVAAGDEHDQPQHRGDERQPPRRAPDRRQVQPGGQQGDEHQQHQRRQLGVDDGVRRALHEAAPLVRRLVARHPVVGGLQRGEHGEQHGDVALRGRPHRRHRRGEHDAAVEDVGEHRHHEHEDHGDEQPVEHEAEERQLEHVEPDVGVELRVVDAERLAVAEQQPRLPLRRRRQGDEERQQRPRRGSGTGAGGARTARGSARRRGARWPGSASARGGRRSAG